MVWFNAKQNASAFGLPQGNDCQTNTIKVAALPPGVGSYAVVLKFRETGFVETHLHKSQFIVKTLGRANRANHAQHLLCDPRSQSAGSENTFWWPPVYSNTPNLWKLCRNSIKMVQVHLDFPLFCAPLLPSLMFASLLVLIPILVVSD